MPSQGNVGDRLTPWLIRRISGAPARWVAPHAPGRKHFVTGSVVALAGPGSVVWGAGVMEAGETLDPRAELLAVRGPLTREAAVRSGVACPPVYGDPGLLVPRFLPVRPVRAGGRPAVVPHFADKARARRGVPAGWRTVDVQGGVEDVVEQLTGACLVASSSLRGIVLSHVYGIPAVWIRFRPLPGGDDSKFHDYFLSVGVPVPPPVPVGADGAGLDPVALADFATLPADLPDLDLLLERCPFRETTSSANSSSQPGRSPGATMTAVSPGSVSRAMSRVVSPRRTPPGKLSSSVGTTDGTVAVGHPRPRPDRRDRARENPFGADSCPGSACWPCGNLPGPVAPVYVSARYVHGSGNPVGIRS
ncbi:hypothetical protein AQF52_6220 [Streptomyces venezuelae]|uniref:polysaccharide pyruvyl transferase family protein n=1 Tax=Streptomyces gardneri TaxID=66892 RepID=UPI0006BD2AAC|nr:polysaccharide pyruvyl transferase family protein [Streptomyces gardneri]ALO11813.1 hypothetical protein AQF52_6220 [Streptomyces venezuelae]QPK48675.1 hypothetical protein H4W23_31235 [Streptomyces gardneri]WRK40151.1 polysaccharide pyruvyl transferase family protein [Streptomyces venezuelae]CUM37631.1 GumL protein [Streptomyces venezuelae]